LLNNHYERIIDSGARNPRRRDMGKGIGEPEWFRISGCIPTRRPLFADNNVLGLGRTS
jgi:hypothetical protein